MKLSMRISLFTLIAFIGILIISSIVNIAIFQGNYTSMLANTSKGIGNSLLNSVEELLSLGLTLDFFEGMEKKCKWMVDKNSETISYCFIADLTGKVLYHNDESVMGQVLTDKAMKAAVTKIEVFQQFYTLENRQYLDVVIPIVDDSNTHIGLIRLGSPMTIISQKIGEYFITAVIVFLLSFIGFSIIVYFMSRTITNPLKQITDAASRIAKGELDLKVAVATGGEVATLAVAFNSMTEQLRNKMEGVRKMNEMLGDVVSASKGIIVNLNSSAKEIEAASQEQTSASNEHASGITEVSATLQELTITAKQITGNVGELVFSSEETVKLLKASEKQLLETVSQLDDVGAISKNNATQINELGKRSVIINEMVELIKEVANKTNILSINASIEASRSGEAGAGFSVVAAEIRELSKETIESAKKADIAAKEIKDFLNSIIISSENESGKVLGSGKTVRDVFENVGSVVSKINNNYGFTQKIDVSIKQQENGSIQAAETMRQMAEIARQSAETARQTLAAAKDIVSYGAELEKTVSAARTEDMSA